MSPALLIVLILTLAAGIYGLEFYSSTRTWVAFWRGHRVVIRFHKGKQIFELDGNQVFSRTRNLQPFGEQKYKEPWTHPALGETEITVTRKVVGNQGEYTLNLEIGDELVPLTELKNFLGRVQQDQEEIFTKLTHGAIEPLGDPRWVAACTILNSVRQSSAVNDEVREAANVLQGEMRSCFESRQRLKEDDLGLLGANETRVAEIQARLEAKIERSLEAVKSIHMATISLEAHADESAEMSRVQETIDFLNVEDEVADFMASISSLEEEPPTAADLLEQEEETVEAHVEVQVSSR